MYKEEVIQKHSPGTIREAYESIKDSDKWKRVSFIDSYDQGYVFDIKGGESLERFLEANGGFRAVFPPHQDWAEDTVRIDCETLVA